VNSSLSKRHAIGETAFVFLSKKNFSNQYENLPVHAAKYPDQFERDDLNTSPALARAVLES